MHHTEKDKTEKTYINRVLEYILSNLSDDLKLEKLSSIAGYSPFHFQRIFKQTVGESPKQYITRLRMEKTANILTENPEISITELTFDSGFSSLSTLSRAFKAHFGTSLTEYRKKNQK